MEFDIDYIRKALEHLRKRDRRPQTPAALSHHYQVGPPLTESEVSSIEHEYSFVTPLAYRRLLLELGNGGAGPNWGLLPFGLWPAPEALKPWREIFPAWSPARPFPWTDSWNEPESFFEQEPEEEGLSEYEYAAAEQRWENLLLEYWQEQFMDGAIPVSEVGCGIFEWLVVAGPEAGSIWVDSRSDYRGIYPLQIAGERVTFENWYMSWLNECLHAKPLPSPSGGWFRRIIARAHNR